MKKLVLVSCGIVLVTLWSCSKNSDTNQMTGRDIGFIHRASIANFAEIQAGQLAADSGTDQAIKDFGQKMVTDHTAGQSSLQSLVTNYTFTGDSLDTEHTTFMQKLKASSGRTFDSLYIWQQVNDHQKSLALYGDESSNGLNEGIKNYANQQLQTLQEHLTTAKGIAASFR